MSGAAFAPRKRFTLISHATTQIRNGETQWLIGRPDGTNGWRPPTGRIARVLRAHMCGNVSVAHVTPNLDLVVMKGGNSVSTDDVLTASQDMGLAVDFGPTEDTTAGSKSLIYTDADWMVAKLYLTTANTATASCALIVEMEWLR